jgi:hypothetical protein
MGEEENRTERGAIKIVDGYITVEIVRRKKHPSDRGQDKEISKIFESKEKAK